MQEQARCADEDSFGGSRRKGHHRDCLGRFSLSGSLFCSLGSKCMPDEDDDQIIYNVVVNHEEQYSIWPASKELPLGWKTAGKSGSKEECLAYIKEVWTDMRPLSLR